MFEWGEIWTHNEYFLDVLPVELPIQISYTNAVGIEFAITFVS